MGAKTVMKTVDSLRSRLGKVKQAMPNSKKGVVYEIPCKDCLCVPWRDRENLAETPKRTQTNTKSTGKLPHSNKRKELLEKKGPTGPSHSLTISDLESGLWTEHQHHVAPPAGQTSLPPPSDPPDP